MHMRRCTGFTLIEVVIFAGIVSVFFVIAASIMTASLRNMQTNERRLIASHLGRELEEWLRVQSEVEWGGSVCSAGCSTATSFTQRATKNSTPGGVTSYCFNSLPTGSTWPAHFSNSTPCGSSFSLNSAYKREVLFTSTSVGGYIGQVNATIVVSWQDLGVTKNVTIRTVLTQLER